MGLFKNNDGGVMDVIRCDEQDYLIWKWHPQGTNAQNSQRTNAIRWGSSLRVRDGSVAVFVYKQGEGDNQDFIEGPFDQIIDTNNFPVLASLIGRFYQGGSPFQAEVYFINIANLIQVQFGVPYFDVFDPRFTDFGVPVAVRGSLNFRIANYREFIKLHSLAEFNTNTFKEQIKAFTCNRIQSIVMAAPDKNGIPVVQIGRNIVEISALVEEELKERLRAEYGVEVSSVNISDIEIDKESKGYKKLESLTQNKASMFVQGATNIIDTVSTHRAGAKKIKETAKGDSRSVVDKVTGAIGGIFGKKEKNTPPPIPIEAFYVVINGEQNGPYDLKKIEQLLSDNLIDEESLVWKKGMDDWEKASEIDALSDLFETTPPPIKDNE